MLLLAKSLQYRASSIADVDLMSHFFQLEELSSSDKQVIYS